MGSEKGLDAFEEHYRQRFGDRWSDLRAAMERDHPMVPIDTGTAERYYVDPASLIVAGAAGPLGERLVLDMCAAPGGKTLAMALTTAEGGKIVANDRSSGRRARLHRVLDSHLPDSIRRKVDVSGRDARKIGLREPATYDLVLLDAPCSSEAHLIRGKGRIDLWSRSRITHIAQDAFTLLRSAMQSVCRGGTIIYSTCSLPFEENEGVVERAVKRSAQKGLTFIERTPHAETWQTAERYTLTISSSSRGFRIWPDLNDGAGPIFFCILSRGL